MKSNCYKKIVNPKMLSVIYTILILISAKSYSQITVQHPSFYIDPLNGSDNNSGTTITEPLRSIVKAQQLVSGINKNMKEDIYVYLKKGTYNLSTTLRFLPGDGGTNGNYVIYKNYDEEKPVISGGKKVVKWTIVSGKKYYQADVPVKEGFASYFRQLYVNGKRATIASRPEPLHGIKWWDDPATPQAVDGIVFDGSGIPEYKTNVKDIRLYHPKWFKADYMPVAAIHKTDSDYIFQMQQPYTQTRYKRGGGTFNLENDWFVQNALEELDTPGEWYLDQVAQKVYYFPVPGDDMSDIEIYAPVLDPIISFEGRLGNKVKNIRVEGLIIEHGNWLFPGSNLIGGAQAEMLLGPDGSSEYSFEIPGQITLNQTENIQFIMNIIRNSGSCGIHVFNGALNTLIEGNVFYGTTAAGILIGRCQGNVPNDEQSEGTIVSNNFITEVGQDFIQATGISLINPYNSKILHNDVSGTPYTAIHQRSVHRGNPAFPKVGNTEIAYNEVHDENWSKLDDNGAIYSHGYNPGTRIHHNWMHNLQGGAGYYNDDLSHKVMVDYNVTDKYILMRDALEKTKPYQNWLENNFTKDPKVRVVGAEVKNNVVVTGDWPPAAQVIINNAGLEPRYRFIKKLLPCHDTDKADKALLGEIERADKNYDPDIHLLWGMAGSGYHSDYDKPTRVHGIISSLGYALDLLDSRKPENRERAFDVLRAVIALQDQDPASKHCGVWPGNMESPIATKKSPTDRNAADFCAVPLIYIIENHNQILPDDVKEKTRNALLLAAKAIRERDVRPDYTNITIVGLYVCYKTAEIYDNADLMAYSRKRLKTFYEATLLNKGFMEYNSPPYFKMSMNDILRLRQFVKNAEDYAMLDSIYNIGWSIIARHYHKPSAQWSGPHGRCYSVLLDYSAYNWFYNASNGLINPDVPRSFSKEKDRYLDHKIPVQYLHYFTLPKYPRMEVDTFIKGGQKIELNPLVSYQESDRGVFVTTNEVTGKSYLTKDYVLSSANRSCLWNQRRPLIAYWGTEQKPVSMQLRFLHNMYDYSSANIFCSQDSANILGAINFTTNGGDQHVTIDVIKNATITARDLRLRLEFGGDISNLNFVSFDTIKRIVSGTSGSVNFRFEIPYAKLGEYEGSLSTGGNARNKWIDFVFYSGREKEFNFEKIQEAVIGFLVSVKAGNINSQSPVTAVKTGKYLSLSWNGLNTKALIKPYSERATLILK